MGFFQNAQESRIYGGEFSEVHGDQNNYHYSNPLHLNGHNTSATIVNGDYHNGPNNSISNEAGGDINIFGQGQGCEVVMGAAGFSSLMSSPGPSQWGPDPNIHGGIPATPNGLGFPQGPTFNEFMSDTGHIPVFGPGNTMGYNAPLPQTYAPPSDRMRPPFQGYTPGYGYGYPHPHPFSFNHQVPFQHQAFFQTPPHLLDWSDSSLNPGYCPEFPQHTPMSEVHLQDVLPAPSQPKPPASLQVETANHSSGNNHTATDSQPNAVPASSLSGTVAPIVVEAAVPRPPVVNTLTPSTPSTPSEPATTQVPVSTPIPVSASAPASEPPATPTPISETLPPPTPVSEPPSPPTPASEPPATSAPVSENPTSPPTPVSEPPSPPTPASEPPATSTPVSEILPALVPISDSPSPPTPVSQPPQPQTQVSEPPKPSPTSLPSSQVPTGAPAPVVVLPPVQISNACLSHISQSIPSTPTTPAPAYEDGLHGSQQIEETETQSLQSSVSLSTEKSDATTSSCTTPASEQVASTLAPSLSNTLRMEATNDNALSMTDEPSKTGVTDGLEGFSAIDLPSKTGTMGDDTGPRTDVLKPKKKKHGRFVSWVIRKF